MVDDKDTPLIEVAWSGAKQFLGKTSAAMEIPFDGDKKKGCSPMEALMASLCSCMGIDVLMILEQMRMTPTSLRVIASGERNVDPPRYYKQIHLRFLVRGSSSEDRIQHAVKLSVDRYCSVLHSLRSDLNLSTSVELE